MPNDNDGLDFLLKVIEKTYHSKLIYLEVRNNYSYDIFRSAQILKNSRQAPALCRGIFRQSVKWQLRSVIPLFFSILFIAKVAKSMKNDD